MIPSLRTVAAAAAACVFAVPASAEALIGLTTTNALVRFDSTMPGNASALAPITGLSGADERIVGIDLRPSTSVLYGLSDAGKIYTLDAMTGGASFVAALMADPTDATNPFTALMGTSFGVDFNPVPDLGMAAPSLRVMSNTGQNLRVNVNPANAGRTFTDGPLNGATMSLGAVAYTNNDTNAGTGTMLFGVDAATDMLYRVGTPNNGDTIAIGPLGVDTIDVQGFEIAGPSRTYANFTSGSTGKSSLYRIDLSTGMATSLGAFGIGGSTAVAPPLADVTVAVVPEPQTYALMAGGLALLGVAARRRRARAER